MCEFSNVEIGEVSSNKTWFHWLLVVGVVAFLFTVADLGNKKILNVAA